jgi:hypothetical protein
MLGDPVAAKDLQRPRPPSTPETPRPGRFCSVLAQNFTDTP